MTTQSDAPSLVTKRSRFTVLGPPDGLGLTLNVVHRLLVPPQWSSRPSDCVVVPKREGPVRLGMSLRVEGEPVDEETVMKSPIPAMLEDALHLNRQALGLSLVCRSDSSFCLNLFPSPSDALHDDASVQPVAELDSIHLTFCFTAAEPTPSRAPSPLESLLLGPDPGPGSEQVLERLVGTLDPATVDTVRQGIATVLQRQMGKRWPLMFNPSYRDGFARDRKHYTSIAKSLVSIVSSVDACSDDEDDDLFLRLRQARRKLVSREAGSVIPRMGDDGDDDDDFRDALIEAFCRLHVEVLKPKKPLSLVTAATGPHPAPTVADTDEGMDEMLVSADESADEGSFDDLFANDEDLDLAMTGSDDGMLLTDGQEDGYESSDDDFRLLGEEESSPFASFGS